MQIPHFRRLGLDLDDCHPGTINVDVAPLKCSVRQPDYRFARLAWCPEVPPETFSFVRCLLLHSGKSIPAWIYYPHPDTKPDHFHSASILEVLAPWVPGVRVGAEVGIEVAGARLSIDG